MKLWFYALAAHNENTYTDQANLQIGHFERETYAEAREEVARLLTETFPVNEGWHTKSMNFNAIPRVALMHALGIGYEHLPKEQE